MKIATPPAPKTDAIQEKFAATRRELGEALIERDDEIDLVLTALIAREHLLLVGPPGCGKSLLLDCILSWMHGTKFSILLTKFTVPEEVVGPISIAALKEDRYRRVTAGRLPEAELAFVDEIWKASSAILNTLLRMLNERTFENDGASVPVPLRLCVAASNEWPSPETGKELTALMDRFLFRKAVRPIMTMAGRKKLLWTRDHDAEALHVDHRRRRSTWRTTAARRLPWSDDAVEAAEQILRELAREGVQPGDRRQYKAVAAAQAYAFLCGADEVRTEHLEVLATVLWDEPDRAAREVREGGGADRQPHRDAGQPAPAGVREDPRRHRGPEPGAGGRRQHQAPGDREAARLRCRATRGRPRPAPTSGTSSSASAWRRSTPSRGGHHAPSPHHLLAGPRRVRHRGPDRRGVPDRRRTTSATSTSGGRGSSAPCSACPTTASWPRTGTPPAGSAPTSPRSSCPPTCSTSSPSSACSTPAAST